MELGIFIFLLDLNSIDKIFIDNNDILAPMWGHGFTKIKSMKGIDNIGAYLSAYLGDIEVSEDNTDICMSALMSNEGETVELEDGREIYIKNQNHVDLKLVEKEVDGVSKKFIKGGRLHLYPSGMNLYRCSRGIKKPDTEEMLYSEVKKIVGSRTANYSRTIDILNTEDNRPLNSITYEQYNLNR